MGSFSENLIDAVLYVLFSFCFKVARGNPRSPAPGPKQQPWTTVLAPGHRFPIKTFSHLFFLLIINIKET